VREVIEMTLEFLAGQGLTLPPTHFDEISNRDLSMVYLAVSAAKARKELGWNPSITLAQGIASYHEFGE
jgi:nucleoside-diphosphate-sugar epimerase